MRDELKPRRDIGIDHPAVSRPTTFKNGDEVSHTADRNILSRLDTESGHVRCQHHVVPAQ